MLIFNVYLSGMPEKKPIGKRLKVTASFAIMPKLLEDAQQKCRELSASTGENVSFSSQMERLVEEWLKKDPPKKKH